MYWPDGKPAITLDKKENSKYKNQYGINDLYHVIQLRVGKEDRENHGGYQYQT